MVLDGDTDWLARSLRAFAAAGYPTSSVATVDEALATLRSRRAGLLVLGPTVARSVAERLRRYLREGGNVSCPVVSFRREAPDL